MAPENEKRRAALENEPAVSVADTVVANPTVTTGTSQRDIKSAKAWCWADKAALRSIREAFDALTYLDQGLAVYLTLCELASDRESSSFEVRKRVIAERSGVSMRRVAEILNIFRAIKLIDWRQNKIEGTKELNASTYILLSCTPCTRSGTESTRSGRNAKRRICRVLEESTEESIEESAEEARAAFVKPSSRTTIDEDWLKGIKSDPAYEGIDVDRELAKMSRWYEERQKHPTRRRFVNWLNRCDRPVSPKPIPKLHEFTTGTIDPEKL